MRKALKPCLCKGFWVIFLGFWGFGQLAGYAASDRAPVITSQPQSATVAEGASASFTVTATGEAPLSYWWFFNNRFVPLANSATLTITNASQTNAGTYIAVVFNSRGFEVSDPAALTVLQSSIPVITQQPQSQTVAVGSSVTLEVSYAGSGPVFFQWRRNGMNVPGATNATLILNGIQPSDAGDYSVMVYTSAGAALSATAAVRVSLDQLPFNDAFDLQFTIPVLSGLGRASNRTATSEPGEPLHAGKTSSRSVWIAWQPAVSGIATISLAGSSFDTLLAVYTGDTLTGLTEVASDDDSAGYFASVVRFNVTAGTHYKIAVDGLAGASGDFTFQWSIEPTQDLLPQIVTQPDDQIVGPGAAATFAVGAIPSGVTFQWLFNAQALPGEVQSALTIPQVSESHVGLYSVRVTRGTRTIESRAATLQINITGSQAQDVIGSDKLADAARLDRPLRLGMESGFGGRAAGLAMSSGVNRGYTGTHVFSTIGAWSDPDEPPHCNIAGGASYWFSFVPAQSGAVRFDTEGSSFDTILAAYIANGPGYGNLQGVACDNNSGADGLDSSLVFNAVAGQTYFIVVDGVRGAQGTVQLHYSLAVPATLVPLGKTAAGANQLRLTGQVGGRFEVQVSGDWLQWTTLLTTNLPTGTCTFVDTASMPAARRYYRAVTLQP